MYVFGGYKFGGSELVEYRFSSRNWSLVKTSGQPPPPRWGHAAIVFRVGTPWFLVLDVP
jgi:hypothetical protein